MKYIAIVAVCIFCVTIGIFIGSTPKTVYIGFQSANEELYGKALASERPDVATYFSNAKLADSGFQIRVNKNHIGSANSIAIYDTFKSIIYKCGATEKL